MKINSFQLLRNPSTSRLGFKEGKLANLNEYEMVIAAHLVVPEDINVSWRDIAGLDGVVQELKESVVLPVKHREMFRTSTLYQAPKGVLLHGPPGCGEYNKNKRIDIIFRSIHSQAKHSSQRQPLRKLE